MMVAVANWHDKTSCIRKYLRIFSMNALLGEKCWRYYVNENVYINAPNEICLPHHFSINYILWPLVELNLSPMFTLLYFLPQVVHSAVCLSSFFYFFIFINTLLLVRQGAIWDLSFFTVLMCSKRILFELSWWCYFKIKNKI